MRLFFWLCWARFWSTALRRFLKNQTVAAKVQHYRAESVAISAGMVPDRPFSYQSRSVTLPHSTFTGLVFETSSPLPSHRVASGIPKDLG